jgi:zinc transporter ZupT
MLKPFRRLFGGSNNSSVSSKTSAPAGFQEVSGAQVPELEKAPAVTHLGLTLDDAGEGIAVLSAARHDIERVRAALAI